MPSCASCANPKERIWHNSITHAYRAIKGRSWTPVASRWTVDGMDRMLDRFIDRFLRWEQRRNARRMQYWKRNMHRDQRLGIW